MINFFGVGCFVIYMSFQELCGLVCYGILILFKYQACQKSDEQKPAITKVIAPAVLFWFRWSALSTIITGLIVAYLNGYIHEALALGIGSGGGKNTAIGIGMWLGLIMAFNVWVIIWPNQKKVLGIVEASPEEKAISAKKALIASRTNTLLSLPMLLCMVIAQNLY